MTQAILKTLAYFDIFDYPLTLVEIWKWLYVENNRSASLSEVRQSLAQLAGRVETKNGFWFLPGRSGIIQTRLERDSIAEKNRLWLTRLLAVGWLKLNKQRPMPGNKKDAIDTNFFLSEADLQVDYLGVQTDDRHKNLSLVYWLDQLAPVYDIDNSYQRFLEANDWLKEYLPNAFGYQLNDRRTVKATLVSRIIGWLF